MNGVAIIASAIDVAQLEREIQREHIALQDGERKEASWSESNAERRVSIGKLLIKAKAASKHGTWLPFLERVGIEERTARNWMGLAGFVESKSETVSDLKPTDTTGEPAKPFTLRDAGIDKRPRKSAVVSGEQQEMQTADARRKSDAADEQPPKLNDLEAALMSLDRMIMKYAQAWPSPSRRTLAQTLRSVAERIERMARD